MVFKDYYKILELKTNKVTEEEIKTAYHEMAKKYHPDINSGILAEERIKDINEAYMVLSKPETKRKFDRIWVSHNRKVQAKANADGRENSRDLLGILFGNVVETEKRTTNKAKEGIKGDNIETEISVSLEDAFIGTKKEIEIKDLNGKSKKFEVKLPESIRDGEKIKLKGQGKKGKNGGENGDLIITIRIDTDSKYKLDGNDLIMDLFLSPWEAALGARLTLQTIDNSINVFIPAGIESGEKIRIPNKGYKYGNNERGDLIAVVKIMIPKKLSIEEREFFTKLSEISKFNPRLNQ